MMLAMHSNKCKRKTLSTADMYMQTFVYKKTARLSATFTALFGVLQYNKYAQNSLGFADAQLNMHIEMAMSSTMIIVRTRPMLKCLTDSFLLHLVLICFLFWQNFERLEVEYIASQGETDTFAMSL
jgi:hypothetical protein